MESDHIGRKLAQIWKKKVSEAASPSDRISNGGRRNGREESGYISHEPIAVAAGVR